uniref:Uncharacterized protein n=1 Tax=Rhizophora mucronata TaxID=61149 RepID=A0A2P2N9B6_RHIMU
MGFCSLLHHFSMYFAGYIQKVIQSSPHQTRMSLNVSCPTPYCDLVLL